MTDAEERRILVAAERYREATEWMQRCRREREAAEDRVEEQDRLLTAAEKSADAARVVLLKAARGVSE